MKGLFKHPTKLPIQRKRKMSETIDFIGKMNSGKGIQPLDSVITTAIKEEPFEPVVFYLELTPNEDVKFIPQSFSVPYGIMLPTYVSFEDPRGRAILIRVLKRGKYFYLTEGWRNFVTYYSLYQADWVELTYTGYAQFKIRVQNIHGVQVPYHCSPGPSSRICLPKFIRNNKLADDFVETYVKRLSFEEVIGTKLLFPKTFSSIALRRSEGEIMVVDENDNNWNCYMTHDIGDPLYSAIVGGWTRFCSEKRLVNGMYVKFGVKAYCSCVLYFIPI